MSNLPPLESKGSDGWLLFGDLRPRTAVELYDMAIDNECDPEEASIISELAMRHGVNDNPYIIIDDSSPPGVLVDVIVPPEDLGIMTIYLKYNGPTHD